jgi:hypothetical protein
MSAQTIAVVMSGGADISPVFQKQKQHAGRWLEKTYREVGGIHRPT